MRVNAQFSSIRAKQLYHPKVLDPKHNSRSWEEYEQKKFPHSEPLYLAANKWALVYSNRDYNGANELFAAM